MTSSARTIYVEGGSGRGDRQARQAFAAFLRDPAGKRSPRITIAGPRSAAIKLFANDKSLNNGLLVDSEGPVGPGRNSVQHLEDCKEIRPGEAAVLDPNRVFLMVECMENWLIADMEGIAIASGNRNVQPEPAARRRTRANGNVEVIPKADAEAVVQASLPPEWSKGKRMELVRALSPEKVRSASAEADRLLSWLLPHRDY